MFRGTKKVTLVKGNIKVKVPLVDELSERQLKKILKKAGVSEEQFWKEIEEMRKEGE